MPMYGRINKKLEEKTFKHQNDKEAEYYRDIVVSQGNEIEILRNNVKELQGQLQGSYRRINELLYALEIERQRNEKDIINDSALHIEQWR